METENAARNLSDEMDDKASGLFFLLVCVCVFVLVCVCV